MNLNGIIYSFAEKIKLSKIYVCEYLLDSSFNIPYNRIMPSVSPLGFLATHL